MCKIKLLNRKNSKIEKSHNSYCFSFYKTMAQFSYGTAAEILRSSQKDVLYTQQLSQMLLDTVNSTFGARATLLYRQRLFALSDMIYYGTTTLSGIENYFYETKFF